MQRDAGALLCRATRVEQVEAVEWDSLETMTASSLARKVVDSMQVPSGDARSEME